MHVGMKEKIFEYLSKRINNDAENLEKLHSLVLHDKLVSEVVKKFNVNREDAKVFFIEWLRTIKIWIEYDEAREKLRRI